MGIINVVPPQQNQPGQPASGKMEAQEVKTPEVNQSVNSDKHLAEMARREKAMRLQSREMAAMKQAIAQREAEYKNIQAELEKERGFKSKLKSSPWDALIEAGFTPEEATAAFLNQPTQESVELKQLRAELAALKSDQETFKKSALEAQEQSYSQAKKQMEAEVKSLVTTSTEAYELINSMDASQQVVDYIESVYQESGQLLDIETAAKHVEDFLLDEAKKFASLKKLQALQGTPAQPVTTGTQLKTLSNQLNAGSKPLTAKERRERAIAAFKGSLT